MLEQVKPLVKLIGHHEARGDYNTIWGGIRSADYFKLPLVQMTVAQVLAWQDSIDSRYRSEAVGLFQILEDTLRDNHAAFGVKLTDLFNKDTQDKMGLGLMRRRGLDKFLAGKITAEDFGQQLSMEWASLPCTIKDKRGRAASGQSYYAGDGLNKSGCSLTEFMAAILATKALTPKRVDDENQTISDIKPGFSLGALIERLIAMLFSSKRP